MPPVNVTGFGVVHFPDSMSESEIAQAIERDIVPQIKQKSSGPSAEELAAGKRQAFKESSEGPISVNLGVAKFDVPRPGRFLKLMSPAAAMIDAVARPDVGRGAEDVVQGAKQLAQHLSGSPDAKKTDAQIADELKTYEEGRGPDAGFDTGRLMGNVGATSFLGLARAPAAAGAALKYGLAAAQGGSAAALNPVDTTKGDFAGQKTTQTAIGAAVAPLAQFGIEKGTAFIGNQARKVGDFLSTTLRRVRGEPVNPNAVVDAAGNLTEQGKAAAEKLGIDWKTVGDDAKAGLVKLANDSTKAGRAMSAEEQLRSTLIKEVTGEDATLGQVTRDFGQQQTEHDLKKITSVGAPIRARFAKQNRGLIQSIDEMTKKAGGTAVDEYETGRRVADSVLSADKEARGAVSSLYKEIDTAKGGKFGAVPDKLLKKVDELSANAEGDAITQSVVRKLRRFGIVAEETNTGLKFDKFDKPFSIKDTEELRKFIGGLDGSSPNKKRMIAELVKALDSDVRASAGEDAYAIARNVAKTRFEDLDIPAVRAIVDGDVKPEQIFDKFVRKGGIDDLTALKGYMSRGEHDPHQTTAAWNELRSEAVKHLFADATKQNAKNELDDVLFSGPMFKKSLDSLGRRKLEVLFTPEELAKLDKITKVAEWRTPMADVLNTSNTNSAWWNMVDKVLSYLPGKSGMVLRGAGRAAKIGADELAQEAAAKAAMKPGEELARRVEEEAAKKTADVAKNATGAVRAPSFFSLGAERKRNK